MPVKTFDTHKSVVMWGTILMQDFADGSAIKIKPTETDWNKQQGSHGSAIRTRKYNGLGEMTVRIMKGSPVNEQINQIASLDRRADIGGTGVHDLTIMDQLGTHLVTARAWVQAIPEFGIGTEQDAVEWVFDCADLDIKHGSQNVT